MSGASEPTPARESLDWAPVALVLLWPFAVLAWRWSLDVEVFALSSDDFSRMLDAWTAAKGSPFPTDVWPPGPAWLVATLLRLRVPLLLAPSAVNLMCITLALLATNDAARRLGVRARHRAAALACVVVGPWPGWLGLSALAEPPAALGFALACHGIVVLCETGSRSAKVEVVLGACLAAICRYEAWAVAAAASLVLGTVGSGGVRARLVWALLPASVPVGWTLLEYHWNGNFEFLTNAQAILQDTEWRPRGIQYELGLVTDFFDACGPAAVLAIWGAWRLRADAHLRPLWMFWTGTALVYFAAGALMFAATHNAPRLWLGHAVTLPLLVGLALREMRVPGRRVLALVAFAAGLGFPSWSPAPRGYEPATYAIAWRTHQEIATRVEGRVMVEAIPWECVAVAVLMGDPDRVVWDRAPTGEPLSPAHRSVLGGSAPSVRSSLRSLGTELVLTGSGVHEHTLAAIGQVVERRGSWTLWRLTPDSVP